MDRPPNSISTQMESFLASAKALETELHAERAKSQRIAKEYLSTRSTLEKAVRELQARCQASETKQAESEKTIAALKARETQIVRKAREIATNEQKLRKELEQFKNAWGEVLTRENEAKNVLATRELNQKLMRDQAAEIDKLRIQLDESRKRLEADAVRIETGRKDLEAALARVHSEETAKTRIMRENEGNLRAKRVAEENVARLERELSEHQEARRLRVADLEHQIDSLTRDQREAQRETERISAELERREAIQARSQSRVQDLESANEKLSLLRVEAENRGKQHERDLAILRLELRQANTQAEEIRKKLTRELLVERLRHENDSRILRAQIENLSREDILVEKADPAEIDGPILEATGGDSIDAEGNDALTATPPPFRGMRSSGVATTQ